MNKYIARAGERLDQIAYSYFGNLDYFDSLLDLNPHLLDKLILDAGDEVYIPQTPKKIQSEGLGALWD